MELSAQNEILKQSSNNWQSMMIGKCGHVYIKKDNSWFQFNQATKRFLSIHPQNSARNDNMFLAQQIDTKGNLWFFDYSDSSKNFLKVFNTTSNKIQKIEIDNEKQLKFRDLVFVDGYVFANVNN